jgi:hypothetical protein
MIETNRPSDAEDGHATKYVYSTYRSDNTIVHLPMWPTRLVQEGIAIPVRETTVKEFKMRPLISFG